MLDCLNSFLRYTALNSLFWPGQKCIDLVLAFYFGGGKGLISSQLKIERKRHGTN